MENMKNAELYQALADNYSKLLNNEITVKESKKISKELDKILKQKREQLKEFSKKVNSTLTEDEKIDLQKQIDNF